jgi:hypothetical protein
MGDPRFVSAPGPPHIAGSRMARTELTRWRVRRYEWSLKRRNPITPTEGEGAHIEARMFVKGVCVCGGLGALR